MTDQFKPEANQAQMELYVVDQSSSITTGTPEWIWNDKDDRSRSKKRSNWQNGHEPAATSLKIRSIYRPIRNAAAAGEDEKRRWPETGRRERFIWCLDNIDVSLTSPCVLAFIWNNLIELTGLTNHDRHARSSGSGAWAVTVENSPNLSLFRRKTLLNCMERFG
jgi:hypothetical protein